jgi:hypothetical protein
VNIEEQKNFISEQLKESLLKFSNLRVTPDVLNNVMKTTMKVLEESNQLDDINNHIETVVRQNEFDKRELLISFIAKDEIGARFLRGTDEPK